MHVTHNNNITIAYATSLATTKIKQTTITHHNAVVMRGDLVSTSKYYKYHKALGHTPQHIQHVSDRQKNGFLLKVASQHKCTEKFFLFMTNQSCPKNKKQTQQIYNKLATWGVLWRRASSFERPPNISASQTTNDIACITMMIHLHIHISNNKTTCIATIIHSSRPKTHDG